MSAPTTNVLAILKELSVSLGQEAVKAACEQFAGGKKQKKERKPRGKSSWNLEVDKVLEEMQAAAGEGETVTYKMAFAEASRRKREGDPEAQAKYEAYRAKVEAKRSLKKDLAAAKLAGDAAAADRIVSELAAVKDEKPTEEAVYNFLFDLRDSGATNMLGCVPYLQEEFPALTKTEAEGYRQNYVSKTKELLAKYRPAPATEKKGRGRPKKAATAE